jgi:hypothetical protein
MEYFSGHLFVFFFFHRHHAKVRASTHYSADRYLQCTTHLDCDGVGPVRRAACLFEEAWFKVSVFTFSSLLDFSSSFWAQLSEPPGLGQFLWANDL